MVSFEAFRAVDGTPVYLQIINFIKRGAIAGTIRDGDTRAPICSWRSSANLLYCNWLNYFVYQATPYDLNSVGIVVMDDFKEQHE